MSVVEARRAHRARRAVQLSVQVFAVCGLTFFGLALGWFVIPRLPIVLPILVGIAVCVVLLAMVGKWPRRRRRSPTP